MFHDNLVTLRKLKNMTQEDIAEKIGEVSIVAKKTTNNIEDGFGILRQNMQKLDEIKAANDITVEGIKAKITGPTKLHGAEVKATDLRAGAAMVAAALSADGVTTITNINHILRGYENIVEKLSEVGAKIEIIEI